MTETIEPTTIPQSETNTRGMMERALLVSIERGKLGTHRKTKAMKVGRQQPMDGDGFPGGVVTDADPEMLRISKVLLKCPELDAITNLFGRVRKYMEEHCMPSMYRRGVWVVPIDLLLDVDAKLHSFRDELARLVDALLDVYEQRCDEAAAKLKSLYNPADYPSTDRVRSRFYLAWQPLAFDSAPTVLRKLKAKLARDHQERLTELEQRAAEGLEARMRSIAQDVEGGLVASFVELVQHMRNSLTPDEEGRRKRFHASTLEKLNGYLALFGARNVTDHQQLAQLVGQAREIMEGVVPDDLRGEGSEPLRDAMREAFEGLSGDLDALVEMTPRRSIRFEDDDDD